MIIMCIILLIFIICINLIIICILFTLHIVYIYKKVIPKLESYKLKLFIYSFYINILLVYYVNCDLWYKMNR